MTARYLNRDQGCRHRNSLVPDTCGSRVHDLCSSATAVGALNGNWSIGHVQWHCGVVCHDCHPGVWSWWLAQLSVLRTQPGLAARMPAAVRCASFWNCSLHIKLPIAFLLGCRGPQLRPCCCSMWRPSNAIAGVVAHFTVNNSCLALGRLCAGGASCLLMSAQPG